MLRRNQQVVTLTYLIIDTVVSGTALSGERGKPPLKYSIVPKFSARVQECSNYIVIV
jgi:hypothetical protein